MSVMEIAMKELGDLISAAESKQSAIDILQSDTTSRAINVKYPPAPLIGAKGDWDGTSGTDDTVAIIGAINMAYDLRTSVWLPDGEFRITGIIDLKVPIDGLGTLVFDRAYAGFLRIPVGYDGITVKNITVDGNTTATAPYTGNLAIVNQANDVKIFNVKTRNTNGSGIRNESGHRLTVAYCNISACRNVFGDGIYSQNAADCKFLFNYIHDVNRIGIVCDTDGTGKSKNPLIMGNFIDNAHDSSGGEINGGIWIENTLGGKIIFNTTKQTGQRGILVVPLIDDGKMYHYLIEGNTVIDAVGTAIVTRDGSTTGKTLANIDIRNNDIRGLYDVGIAAGIHCNVNIDQNYFGSDTVQSLILTDMSGYVDKVNIKISRCSKETMTYTSTTVKDIHLFNKGMIDLTIQDMVGQWTYDMPADQIIGTLKGINTSFVFDSSATAYLCNFIGVGGNFDNCDFTINTSQQVAINTPSIIFKNCRFRSADSTVKQISFIYGAYDNNFIDCKFDRVTINDLTQDPSGNFKYLFKDTDFNEYGAGGAIRCAFDFSASFDVRVLECSFKDSGGDVPIQKFNVAPTKLIVRNAISPTASAVSGMTPTVEVGTIVA